MLAVVPMPYWDRWGPSAVLKQRHALLELTNLLRFLLLVHTLAFETTSASAFPSTVALRLS